MVSICQLDWKLLGKTSKHFSKTWLICIKSLKWEYNPNNLLTSRTDDLLLCKKKLITSNPFNSSKRFSDLKKNTHTHTHTHTLFSHKKRRNPGVFDNTDGLWGHYAKWNKFEKTLMLGKIEAGGEGDDRGWDGLMASPTQWTWVWVDSGSWWWTGRPGVLWFMGSQRVGYNWATELNWTEHRERQIYIISLTCRIWN